MGWLDRMLGRDFGALVARADKLFDTGQFGLARQEYQAALGRAGDGDGADRLRQRLTECRARLTADRRARADELEELGHYGEAAVVLREALDLCDEGPDREALFEEIRRVEARMDEEDDDGDGPEAEGDEFLGESVEDRFEIHMMGIDDEEMADAYRALGPDFAAAFVALQDGRADEALETLEALAAADEVPSLVRRELGRALLLAERAEQAVPPLQRYVEEAPDDLTALHSLAEALDLSGDRAGARETLDAALEAEPESVATRIHLADLLSQDGEGEAAVDLLAEGVPLARRSIPLHRALGMARLATDDGPGARTAFETALSLQWTLDNDTGELTFDRESAWALAQLLLRDGGSADRVLDLVGALRLAANDDERPALLLAQGRAHRLLDQRAEARDALVTARTLVPEDAEALRGRIDEELAALE